MLASCIPHFLTPLSCRVYPGIQPSHTAGPRGKPGVTKRGSITTAPQNATPVSPHSPDKKRAAGIAPRRVDFYAPTQLALGSGGFRFFCFLDMGLAGGRLRFLIIRVITHFIQSHRLCYFCCGTTQKRLNPTKYFLSTSAHFLCYFPGTRCKSSTRCCRR